MKFLDKQLSLKLKEKGFNKLCFGYYHPEASTEFIDEALALNCDPCNKETPEKDIDFQPNLIGAPTIEQVLEWLRDEKNIHIGIVPYFTISTKNNIMWGWEILLVGKIIECTNILYIDKDYNHTKMSSEDCYANYDDACFKAIEFVINNLI